MTLPNDDFKTIRKVIKTIKEKHPELRLVQLAIDAQISPSAMSLILNYSQYRPGRYVEEQLRKYVKKLKQKYPEDCPQEVKPK